MLDLKYSTILRVALPLMVSSFIQSVVMITDSAFLSRYSIEAYDASGNAGLIYITMFVALMGMSDGSQILMARRVGEKREEFLPRLFGTTLLTNVGIAIILFSIIQFFLPSLINAITEHELIAKMEIQFIQIRGYGLFFAMVALAINAYFMAIGKTKVVLISAILTAMTNVWLDRVLIFGEMGFPKLGLEGAAIASTMSDAVGMLFLIFALYLSKDQRRHELISKIRFSFEAFKSLINVGSPILLQGLVALITWTAFFTWIEQMGIYELTVSQNIRAIYFLAFVPIWGFAATTKTYVSQYVGSQAYDQIKIIRRKIQFLTILFLVVLFHGSILYPEQLIEIVNPKTEYIDGSAQVLRFVSGSILIYGFTNVYFQTINGSGNTRFTFYIEAISVGIYLICAFSFIKVFEWDIYWIWTVEYIYFICIGLLSMGYLRFFNWQKKKI